MNYYMAFNTPNLLVTWEERRKVKNNEIEDIKGLIFKEMHPIDDPIDQFSRHTLLHDAVIMNREDLFYFLI